MSGWHQHDDARLDAPAFHRNRAAMVEVLSSLLAGRRGPVLEVGCGSGQHALAFAEAMPALDFWPTDPDPAHVTSANAWRATAPKLHNLHPARVLDAHAEDWLAAEGPGEAPAEPLTAIQCANVIHIAPWPVAEALFAGASRHLAAEGLLLLYGPFRFDGQHHASSNENFDQSLKARDPAWGVRDVADLDAVAAAHGLERTATRPMPANNHLLCYARTTPSPS